MLALEMRMIADNNGRKEHERKAYAYFDNRIKEAASQGRTKMFFGFNGGYLDDETGEWINKETTHITREDGKEHYKKQGFTFSHVGVIGGVMQARDQEYICW